MHNVKGKQNYYIRRTTRNMRNKMYFELLSLSQTRAKSYPRRVVVSLDIIVWAIRIMGRRAVTGPVVIRRAS